jgi:hypothetical protein
MDHRQAIDTQAVERYLLGELPAGEAEDFERHYFECPECALSVESGTLFIADARAVLSGREEPERLRKPFWNAVTQSWMRLWARPATALSMAAAVVLGAVALYQGYAARDVARPLPMFQLTGASRGEGVRIAVPAGTPSFALSADVPPDVHFERYVCALTSGGRIVFRVISPAPPEGQPITVLAPVRGLKTGNYELVISGLGPDGRESDKILADPFEFQSN